MPTALFSTYNKAGVVEFAKSLHRLNWKIIASGGTAKAISDAHIPVTDIATVVGEPILGHRVVTLSREVHAGLLAQRTPEDRAELERLGIDFIDLVYVNLYPLVEEIGKSEATIETVTEKTDIGGPTMLRSAAKGRRFVITNQEAAMAVLQHLESNGGLPIEDDELLRTLAASAEQLVATYCLASAIALTPSVASRRRLLAAAYHQITGSTLHIGFNE